MKRRNVSDDGERGNKKLREHAVCELSSSQESSSTQSAKEILRRRLNRSGCNKMKSVFLDRKIMLPFQIGLRSCQILDISVKCGRQLPHAAKFTVPIVALIIEKSKSGSSSLELFSELLRPEVFSKYSHRKRPKLTVILFIGRSQGCALRFRPLYNRNNSDGKASLKRQRTPETTTDTKDVSKFY